MVRGEPGGNGMASVSGGGVAEVPISELVFDRSGNAENLGMADDVMDEVSKCFELIGEMDGKKEDFMRMMAGLEGIFYWAC